VANWYEIWILEVAPNYRRGWVLSRGDHYAADAARLPGGARLVWAGESTLAEATTRAETLFQQSLDAAPVVIDQKVDRPSFFEGPPGQPLVRDANDTTTLLEACFAFPTRRALLYEENLPPAFFDVSSGQPGLFLQKLRTYDLRVAVVARLDSVPMSRRFRELLAAERRDRTFDVFDSREAARIWLAGS